MTDWSKTRRDEAVAWYAETFGVQVFKDVPVTRPGWAGWPDGTNMRFEDIAIGYPTVSPGVVVPFDEAAFRQAVSSGRPVRPLVARGYADRTVFGWLVTRQAFVARSWQPRGPVLPITIVASGASASNVAPAYSARGFEIVSKDSETGTEASTENAVRKPAAAHGSAKGRDPWNAPKRGEDELLHELWERRGRQGWWLAEVPVGSRAGHNDPTARRFDAVVIESPIPRDSRAGADLGDFGTSVASGVAVELVEAKKHLSADAVGQLLSGAHLFSDSWPEHGPLTYTLCVRHQTEAALRWFCASQGIKVEEVDAGY